jgi:hypothetical protein
MIMMPPFPALEGSVTLSANDEGELEVAEESLNCSEVYL